jgi:hypothetical protein
MRLNFDTERSVEQCAAVIPSSLMPCERQDAKFRDFPAKSQTVQNA